MQSGDVRDGDGRESAKLAYAEVTRNHQGISEFRAKLLALLPLASGAGIFFLLGDAQSKASAGDLAAIGLFGFTVTFGLFMYELRGIQQCHHLRDQATRLEEGLRFPDGCAPFRNRTTSALGGIVGAEGAGWIVYTAVMTSWLYLAGSGTSLWQDGRGFALVAAYLIVLAIAWSRSPRGRAARAARIARRAEHRQGPAVPGGTRAPRRRARRL
jgi:hypothetical protein